MLFRQKYLSLFIIVMMFFVIASGGCGGGSSSNIPNDNDNPNQENPDNPNNPNNPTPNNPETKYDFSILEGTWKASNCTGTARIGDLTAEMSLSTTHDTITFTDVIVNGSTGTFEGTSDIILTIEGYTEWEDEFGGSKPYDIGGYEYQNISGNTWRMERLNHEGETVRVTITFTSSTTVHVEQFYEQFYETETGTVQYSYKLTKQ